jgi:hypothetical protein
MKASRLIWGGCCALAAQVAWADTELAGPYALPPLAAASAVLGQAAPTDARSTSAREPRPNLPLRNAAIIGSGAAAVAAYGMSKWWNTGFGGGFKSVNEGFFGRDTPYGGADKLGHMYFDYAGVRLMTPLFEAAGNTPDASVRLAAWSTLGIMTAVEVADGFSRQYRFSPQDALMNVAGTLLGVVLQTHPELDEKFDFRVAYRRSPGSGFNPFSDYSGQRYLLVAKADGFAPLRENRWLRYVELGIGYQARGFDPGGERRRDVYVGLSLNLSRLLADTAYDGRMHSTPLQRGTDRLFELVQFPAAAYVNNRLD